MDLAACSRDLYRTAEEVRCIRVGFGIAYFRRDTGLFRFRDTWQADCRKNLQFSWAIVPPEDGGSGLKFLSFLL